MGIRQEDIERLDTYLPGWQQGRVAVLGSQWIRETGQPFSAYAKDNAISYTIFDWNGEDGALTIDLCATIPEEYISGYDLVLNCGTSEHCLNQEAVFRNIHALCCPGGAMAHNIPAEGHWPRHSPYKYGRKFLSELCEMNGYTVLVSESTSRCTYWMIANRGSGPFIGIPEAHIAYDADHARPKK